MHTEHIHNLHPGWVLGGWLLSVAVTSVAFMVFVGLGLIGPGSGGTGLLVVVAVAVGFFAGGLFVGLRWSDAPILHGAAITFTSVLVWFLGDLFIGGDAAGAPVDLSSSTFALGMVLLQLVAAVAGGWAGRTMVRRGETPDPGI